jgi:hypothetical protein
VLLVAYVTRQINSRRSRIWRICLLNAHFFTSEYKYYHSQYHNYCFCYSKAKLKTDYSSKVSFKLFSATSRTQMSI